MTGAPAEATAHGPRQCPCCLGEAIEADPRGGREGVYYVARCTRCGLGVTEPRAALRDLPALYPPEYYGRGGPRFRPLAERLEVLLRQRRAAWISRLHPVGAVLDVGCGHGYMLAALRALGWTVQGVELHADAADYARRVLALPVAVGAFEALPLAAASFDVVIFWQSFEHVPDPAAALATAARVLRPGGILVVSVPNAASWQARWAGPAWFHWELPRHLYHFAPDTLAATCARAGFVVERVIHTNWEQNPFGWTQSILNRLGFPPNRLFQGMRASRPGVAPGRAERLLFLPLLALGFLLAGLEALARRGGTITLVARRGDGPLTT